MFLDIQSENSWFPLAVQETPIRCACFYLITELWSSNSTQRKSWFFLLNQLTPLGKLHWWWNIESCGNCFVWMLCHYLLLRHFFSWRMSGNESCSEHTLTHLNLGALYQLKMGFCLWHYPSWPKGLTHGFWYLCYIKVKDPFFAKFWCLEPSARSSKHQNFARNWWIKSPLRWDYIL